MKMFCTLWLACLLAVALPARADDGPKELARLQGTWSVASVQEGGKEQADEKSKNLSIVIKDDLFIFKYEGQPKTLDMKLKLDPTTKPKSANLASTMREGQVAYGIYELDGDELKVCWTKSGKAPSGRLQHQARRRPNLPHTQAGQSKRQVRQGA